MPKVTGTLKYVTGFTGFSNTAEEQEGNFLALNAGANEGSTVTASGTNETKIDGDLVVIRVTDKTKPLTITATKDGQSTSVEFDLSGLTLTAKPAPAPTLGSLTVTASKLANGKATLTLPTPDAGNKLKYQVTDANAKPTVAYDQDCSDGASGFTAIPAGNSITGAAGQVVTVVECTSDMAKARKVGTVTLA